MNYTKGEWEVEVIKSEFPKLHKVYARIKPSIGYVGWDDMGVYDDPGVGKRELKTLNQEALANAHLIAAAPDMYEACLSALGALATLDSNKGWVKEISGVIQKALTKAEGK